MKIGPPFPVLQFLALAVLFAGPPTFADDAGKAASNAVKLEPGRRIAAVGNATAERMNLFGHFETRLHLQTAGDNLVFRNFGWPADEVGVRQRPSSYTTIDDPLKVYGADTFLCFYGFNESFAGDDDASVASFVEQYRKWIAELASTYAAADKPTQFVLVSPTAFESTGNEFHPDADQRNASLRRYSDAIAKLAAEDGHGFVNLFDETVTEFQREPGAQFTINGAHLNEAGDQMIADLIDAQLLGGKPANWTTEQYENVQKWVNDKSWLHQQDYRMLNGWYVYGGRRTWDTETFPTEYRKIRAMNEVRDQYIWDLASAKPVPEIPDDSNTGEVFTPETMFGTRDENFRQMREPEELIYPTPEESIEMMKVPEGFKVELFASEREFPELANPNQIAFDSKGRLWVSCMPNYPQWQPGAKRPDDRLLILEDTDGDGRADKSTTFYDKLICPTGFEFYDGGVLVVDEPRILFLKDTDGDDQADEVIQLVDGIATDDTHHTVGAWEFSHSGLLHMLEGISLSTTLETPWGAFRNRNRGGTYIYDTQTMDFRHFVTPGYGNPWCLVFDQWNNGIVGDGTNAKQHWTAPLSGKEVDTRKTLQPVFDNEGMRPAVGNEFLLSRHLPDSMQGQFIYACVINMHGMPRFNLRDEEGTAGMAGERVEDLLSSTDMTFRPVDPKIGPDGAIWFGDWCNALIGHMQYSQRDPNRDHTHGRVYRMINQNKPLLPIVNMEALAVPELLDQLLVPELRTRYRVRRELRLRDKAEVLTAINAWIEGDVAPHRLCEAMWMQESFKAVDPALVQRIMASDDWRARGAAVHTAANEITRMPSAASLIASAAADENPRVRLEAVRAASFLETDDALEVALSVVDMPMDYWISYTLEHTLHALEPLWKTQQSGENFLASSSESAQRYFKRFRAMSGPGGAAFAPLEIADDVDAAPQARSRAIHELAGIRGGNRQRGEAVFKQVCSACHKVGELGKKFGPDLSAVGSRMDAEKLIRTIVMPNEEIAKGYETVLLLTYDGTTHTGFILREDDEFITLGIANGKEETLEKEEIEIRKDMKASSMPEGLVKTIAPVEFLDLIEYLKAQKDINRVNDKGWVRAEYQKELPLRKQGDAIEISRGAAVKLGDGFQNNAYNTDTHLLLSPIMRDAQDFVFHSDHDVKNPFVTIRLEKSQPISKLWLRNRVNSAFHYRTEGLTVWVSDDNKDFTKVWSADEMMGEWVIDFPAGTTAKYIRIGLDGEGTFHLYQAAVFGPEAK
ncbi:F5/8 type C domain protein [Rubripirellula lacrimiformis]|uniref:F5/8 type C domain protein n=1 Tax=Rubripirellula lacrimiformis TaxID=1930273 RepID=A0A517NBW8_9BACT|nr:PVC-type heme-binding CxxCH protein [Rubripirellula lacrimiformis]QDT04630.1 F5/8 type C domain protein [Rubripirellula lacrimiformis]